MIKKESDKTERIDSSEKPNEQIKDKPKKKEKKSQGQILEETLGLAPGALSTIEKRLFVARFTDYFSEETLDYIYRDKHLEKYKVQINEIMKSFSEESEEDKLLTQSLKNKQIFKIFDKLKTKAEIFASENGFKQAIDKKVRKFSLLMSIPMLFLVILFTVINQPWSYYALFPLLCVFCTLSSYPRMYFIKKWQKFKEENKMEFYTKNREDIMILKGFTGEALDNTRTRLLEFKIPLQLIKFILYSNDYSNLKVHTSKTQKGKTQYVLSLDYPPGMEPIPIPEELAQVISESDGHLEENFIVLKSLKAKNGIIEKFIPTLKEEMAIEINNLLNKSKFSKSSKDISIILPNYSPENAIHCSCGEYVEIDSVQECNWMKSFKFYLFEGKACKCGEKVYAISLMDENTEIPKELEKIFLD